MKRPDPERTDTAVLSSAGGQLSQSSMTYSAELFIWAQQLLHLPKCSQPLYYGILAEAFQCSARGQLSVPTAIMIQVSTDTWPGLGHPSEHEPCSLCLNYQLVFLLYTEWQPGRSMQLACSSDHCTSWNLSNRTYLLDQISPEANSFLNQACAR